MERQKLFLGLTGSVASIKVCALVDEATRRGMEVKWHPTAGAVPFVISTICKKLAELGCDSCAHLSQEILEEVKEVLASRVAVDLGSIFLRIQDRMSQSTAAQMGTESARSISRCIASFEDGIDIDGYFTHERGYVRHINVATEADVALVAPATANTLAKIVNGVTDNFLLEVLRAMAPKKQVFLALAMNTAMLKDPFTARNRRLLTSVGSGKYQLIEPVEKLLQCGTYGNGAMASVEDIFTQITSA